LGITETLNQTLTRFRNSLKLYAAACLIIRDKNSKLRHLEFNEAQEIVQSKLTTQLRQSGRIRAIILKARQEGVSTLTAARFFRAAHLYPGQVVMVVADELIRAGAIFQMYERFFENLPPEIAPRKKGKQAARYLSFTHDSEISVRPANDPEAGRAQTIHKLHASELAFWGDRARDTWTSLMQAVPRADGSEVIIESTAKGAGGLFHELWEAAEQEPGEWIPIFLPWWIHKEYELEPDQELRQHILESPDDFEKQALTEGIPYEGTLHKLSLEKLAWRRAVIVGNFGGSPERPSKDSIRMFQQEYPATAEEAFLVSGSCFFDEDALRHMARAPEVKDPEVRGRLLLDENKAIHIEPNIRGFVRMWEAPDERAHYVVGADTAEGKLVASRSVADTGTSERGGRDYSSAVVLRLSYKDKLGVQHPARVVAELHGRIAPEVFSEQLRLLGEFYSCGGPKDGTYRNRALIGVERSHSSGQTVLRLLREHYRYFPLYWHREINRLTRRIGRRVGWVTDVTSRMPMLDAIGELIRNNKLVVPSKDLIREMTTFVLWDDGKPQAEEGCHDDRVIALAIANQMTREHRHTRTGGLPEYEVESELVG
jgi:hypothetical protein